MCLSHKITPQDPDFYDSANFSPNVPGSSTNVVGGAIQSAPSARPTAMGRVVELATGGAYDPTGGFDTTPDSQGNPRTKFGALVSILRPALEGAAIGGLTGRWHPGGGFGGATEFYQNQRLRQMQAMQFLANQAKLQSEIGKNAAETQWLNRRGIYSRPSNAMTVVDNDPDSPTYGKNVVRVMDANGQLQTVGAAPDKSDNWQLHQVDQGFVWANPRTREVVKAALNEGAPKISGLPSGLSIPGFPSDAASDIASRTGESAGAPSKAAAQQDVENEEAGLTRIPGSPSGSPGQSPQGIAASGGVPIHPPGYSTPRVGKVANRNAAGIETDSLIDENPHSQTFGKVLKSGVASRAPLPDRSQDRTNTKNDDTARVEQYAGTALAQNGGDPDKAVAYLNGLKIANPKAAKDFNRLLPQIRKSIRDRAKKVAKPNPLGLSPEDWNALTNPNSNQTQVPMQP